MSLNRNLMKMTSMVAVVATAGLLFTHDLATLVVIGVSAALAFSAIRQAISLYAQARSTYIDTMAALILAVQPPNVQAHCRRVAMLSGQIAEAMGLPAGRTALIRAAALLHEAGADVIAQMPMFDRVAEWIRLHSSWRGEDGSPSPSVPIEVAIISVADCFDVLTHDPCGPLALDNAIDDIRRRAGSRFHPAVVKALLMVALNNRNILR